MNSKIYRIIIGILLLNLMCLNLAYKAEASSNTLNVGDGYTYSKIQEAIDAASDGDIIYVHSGTYYENIVINKSVGLIGESRYTTIIDGNHSGKVIRITADGVIISNFTITGSGGGNYDYAIDISSDYNEISYNIITKNWRSGIRLDGSSHNHIHDNLFKDNEEGGIGFSSFHPSNDNIIERNTFKNTSIAVWIWSGKNNQFYYNDFYINHSYNIFDMSGTNIWYNKTTKMGNYWDNYTGQDSNGDGIGDTPYILYREPHILQLEDKYPLMEPYNKETQNQPIIDHNNSKEKDVPGFQIMLGIASIIILFLLKRI